MKARLFAAVALLVGVMSIVACGKKEEAPAPATPVVEVPAAPVAETPAPAPAPVEPAAK